MATELYPTQSNHDESFSTNHRYCFCIPSRWQTLDSSSQTPSLFSRGISALKKIREWSELVAGPRWKTFIRRFNRNNRQSVKFQYDPIGYAMNFDQGPLENGDSETENEYMVRNFSSRYAVRTVSIGSHTVVDVSKDGIGSNSV